MVGFLPWCREPQIMSKHRKRSHVLFPYPKHQLMLFFRNGLARQKATSQKNSNLRNVIFSLVLKGIFGGGGGKNNHLRKYKRNSRQKIASKDSLGTEPPLPDPTQPPKTRQKPPETDQIGPKRTEMDRILDMLQALWGGGKVGFSGRGGGKGKRKSL